jgi:hypothetical protein
MLKAYALHSRQPADKTCNMHAHVQTCQLLSVQFPLALTDKND